MTSLSVNKWYVITAKRFQEVVLIVESLLQAKKKNVHTNLKYIFPLLLAECF